MDLTLTSLRADRLPKTIADRTRRVYDRMAFLYPASSLLFHSKAHRRALGASGIEEGMRVLEVATGSGEMFRRLIRVNRSGATVGLDLSPNMAARTQKSDEPVVFGPAKVLGLEDFPITGCQLNTGWSKNSRVAPLSGDSRMGTLSLVAHCLVKERGGFW